MQQCEFLAGCPIFNRFKIEGVRNTWIVLYCRGPKWEQCERRIRRLRGETVPPLLLPNGDYLPQIGN